jgi:hypothetical protein
VLLPILHKLKTETLVKFWSIWAEDSYEDMVLEMAGNVGPILGRRVIFKCRPPANSVLSSFRFIIKHNHVGKEALLQRKEKGKSGGNNCA